MGNRIRCEICGKFISYKEFDEDKIKITFTPDTEYTTEETLFYHKSCIENNKIKNDTQK